MSFSEHDPGSHSPAEQSQRLDYLAGEPRLLTRLDVTDAHDAHARIAESVASLHRHQLASSSGGPRPSRRRRLLLFIAVIIGMAALALAAAASIWLRHSMRAALPVVDGNLRVAGLQAPVTVTRNAQGVPSIRASNRQDLLFAQGFVTSQDRLWQMDILRRHAAGELAEILGSRLVEHDKTQRYLQLRAAADRSVASLAPDQLQDLEAYSRGVNAFIDSHKENLPVEFHLLHYAPRRWTPRDCLLISFVMWQDLTTNFAEKLNREALSHHLPSQLLADLYPVGSWRDRPPTQPKADLTLPHEVEEIPLDPTQSQAAPAPSRTSTSDLLLVAEAFSMQRCFECRAGSNNWAVSGARSASGSPLLSTDMHLSLSAPDIWYETVLHTNPGLSSAGINVAGFALPGVPWILVGRNAHVAWSFTNLGADVQDVRLEHLRTSPSRTEFEQADGTWLPVHHHPEHIVVRGGPDVTLDVLSVTHPVNSGTIESPIISPLLPTEKRTLSLDWTLYDPACVTASFASIDEAADGSSLMGALASFGGPALNLIFADDHGHIGYHAIGRIPIRGSVIPHARPTQEPPPETPETSEPDSEEDNDQGAELQSAPASLRSSASVSSASLLFAAFNPAATVRNRRQHASNSTARHDRRASHARKTPSPDPSQQSTVEPTVSAPPVDLTYTIGSPISPIPVDALDATQLWSAYIPYDELPATQDPASGVLATANSRITPDNYPYAITSDWADPYRAERIYHLLEQRTGLTPQAMLSIETDQHSEFDLAMAQRFAYAIDHASKTARGNDADRLRKAADMLRTWNGEMAVGSSAAAIVAAAHAELWRALLAPQIVAHDGGNARAADEIAQLYMWRESDTALETLLQHRPSRWLPPGVASWNDLLTSVVEHGLQQSGAPRDLSRWQYGAIHSISIEHPLFGGRPWLSLLLGTSTGGGPQPIGGDATTIDASAMHFGPSERFTADLSSPDASIANITTGESGNPASAWYLDQFLPWLHGTSFRLALNQNSAEHTLTLQPSP